MGVKKGKKNVEMISESSQKMSVKSRKFIEEDKITKYVSRDIEKPLEGIKFGKTRELGPSEPLKDLNRQRTVIPQRGNKKATTLLDSDEDELSDKMDSEY
jgi:hypothetical protein